MENLKQSIQKKLFHYNDQALGSWPSFLTTKLGGNNFKISILEIMTSWGFTFTLSICLFTYLSGSPNTFLIDVMLLSLASIYLDTLVSKLIFLSYVQENVEGDNCDLCKPGFYNLKERNPEGCSECFCFGVSDVCDSLSWSLSQVRVPSLSPDLGCVAPQMSSLGVVF